MKKNLIFNLAATLLFFVLFWMNKCSGYVESVAMASPTTFFLTVCPLFLIYYVFNIVALVTWKTRTKEEIIFKVMMLVHIHILTICNLLSSQIYVVVGTNLQIVIMVYVYLMAFIFVSIYAKHLYTEKKLEHKHTI